MIPTESGIGFLTYCEFGGKIAGFFQSRFGIGQMLQMETTRAHKSILIDWYTKEIGTVILNKFCSVF